jgi:hypothetical protein
MKTLILFAPVVLILVFCVSILGQASPAPPGAGDRSIGDRTIKDRSIELERIDREMHKSDKPSESAAQPDFAQVKEDFEQIQVSFDVGVVRTYKMSNPIDYKKIAWSSDDIKDRAIRLKANLFPAKPKKSKDKKDEAVAVVAPMPSDVKTLIMALNDSLASFVASPIFRNAKVIDPKDSEKARLDLEAIIAQSTSLSQEAEKKK